MKNIRINPERVFLFFSSVFLLVAFLASLVLPLRYKTLITSQKVVTITHAVCFSLSIITLIKPIIALEVIIVLSESVLTMMTGYSQLGVFLFYALLILMFVKEQFKTHPVARILPIVIIHALSILACAKLGWVHVFLGFASSFFYMAFFYWIYDILRTKLACFLPAETKSNSVIKEKHGDPLHLTDYKLSERQMDFVLDNLHENCTYKDLSEKYFVSLSTVKKEFSILFKIFGVKNLEELHLLLLQYKVSR